MPTYEYRCTKCGEHFETWQSIHDEGLKKHPGCGGKLEKVLGSVGIVLKGSGFYRTDSRAAARSGASKGRDSDDSRSDESKSGDSKSGDSKSGDSKSGDSKSGDSKSGDSKSTEKKSGDSKDGDSARSA